MNVPIRLACAGVAISAALVLVACKAPAPPAEPTATQAPQVTADTSEHPARSTDVPAPQEPGAPATVEPAAFVDRVWQVTESSAVERGTTYAFLSDGTLVIDSPNGTPMRGKWSFENGALTMVEEDIPYRIDILELSASTFRIRSHNPGEPVDIAMAASPNHPLPKP
ncbi:hypothetical protein QLQ15_06825 [Lysobacter sp. LF1]|uniref:DUF4822 domain-containing protein n=1 Tax=Lysobacter stagni TaxID=3045172 RepID=A0ABT6XER8_9GAMM|nr:hypothetical protein [Lysobacter sp. LF1]MDI9238628.1 hypothetical protein [Lysobacter sp. LF1]